MGEAILAIVIISGTLSMICATILIIILTIEYIQEHIRERKKVKLEKKKESCKTLW